jgi:two-component system, OmpR family, KDP operon response regulator KdpE
MRPRVMLLNACGRADSGFAAALERKNIAVEKAADMAGLLQKLAGATANLVVLCLDEPGSAAVVALCRSVRRATEAPLMVVAVAAGDDTAVQALAAGADLVVLGQHEAGFLAAQVEAVLRCVESVHLPRPLAAGKFASHDGRLAIDLAQHCVQVAGVAVALTPIETRLLALLLHQPGRVLSYDEILHHVWGWEGESRGNVHAYIRSLRHKLGDRAAAPRYIANEFGFGYRLLPGSIAPQPERSDPATLQAPGTL